MMYYWQLLLLSLFISTTLNGQLLSGIEAVEYDHQYDRWLVSNGNSIVAIDATDQTTQIYFGDGASASHGMEVMDGYLFAISGGNLNAYKLSSGSEMFSIAITGASFMNGMTNDGNGNLYITDFSGSKIYHVDVSDIENPDYEVMIANTGDTPNGIVYDGENNRLVYVTWGNNAKVKAIDLTDNSISELANTGLGNIDGIDRDNDGNYFICSWSPAQLRKYTSDFASFEDIDVPGINSPADLCYSLELDQVAIPNGNNTVSFVQFDLYNPPLNIGEGFIDEGKQWNVIYSTNVSLGGGSNAGEYLTYIYRISGLEMIDAEEYYVIQIADSFNGYENWENFGYLRDDETSISIRIDDVETILFSRDWTLSESVTIMGESWAITEQLADIVLTNGEARKQYKFIKFDSENYQTINYIEGIGYTSDTFFTPKRALSEEITESKQLVCFYVADELLYFDYSGPGAYDCVVNFFYDIEELSKFGIELFQENGFLIIDENNDFEKYDILDAMGKTLIQNQLTKNNHINISRLPAGFYIVQLRSDVRSISAKFYKP